MITYWKYLDLQYGGTHSLCIPRRHAVNQFMASLLFDTISGFKYTSTRSYRLLHPKLFTGKRRSLIQTVVRLGLLSNGCCTFNPRWGVSSDFSVMEVSFKISQPFKSFGKLQKITVFQIISNDFICNATLIGLIIVTVRFNMSVKQYTAHS